MSTRCGWRWGGNTRREWNPAGNSDSPPRPPYGDFPRERRRSKVLSPCDLHGTGCGCSRQPPASKVLGQADAGELPAGFGRKKVAIGPAHVAGGRDARTAAQDHLVAHKLAVVFAQGAGGRREARVGS